MIKRILAIFNNDRLRTFRRISLSSAPFYSSLVVITSLAFFIGIFWGINEYQAYKESIDNIRRTYRNQYEARVKEELDKVVELIDYRREQSELRVEFDLRERVQAAYTIASHNYQLYKDEKTIEEIRWIVAELLRPVRWSDSKGYYFAGRVGEGILDLFADEPYFEGKSVEVFAEINQRNVIGEILAMIKEKEAGLYRYDLVKPKFEGMTFSKISFVKYFPPLDWFIGAGVYSDDLDESLQQEVLTRIQNLQFGKDGEVFCFRSDGTILANQDKRLIGRSIADLTGSDEQPYGEIFLSLVNGSEKGFLEYNLQQPESEKPRRKLGFVQSYDRWGWGLGAAMFMDEMEKTILKETETYRQISFENVSAFIILFAIAVVFLLLSTFYFSIKIRQGISHFTNFFREAADAKVKIPTDDLVFREFEDLSNLANKMVDAQIKNELLLHRDELRLDTLLQLGMMEKHSLQEKYDFILGRIVQITRSEEGYLALVNSAQSHITICSYVVKDVLDMVDRDGELTLACSVEEGGMPGNAVLKKNAIIVNQTNGDVLDNTYPYRNAIIRHLDVPIYNDGKIVVVAGVCNNSERYDNSDIRQMTMLLEGMWLHVLQQCAQEELAKLERQIIAVSEEERSKIGRDLHDDLGSHLTGVELLCTVLKQKLVENSPEKAEQVDTIRSLIRDAIEKTRRLSHGLYPVHVVEYGLQSAIDELVVEVEKMFNVDFDLSWEGGEEGLGKNTSTHLHYIIREAAFNAARHGKPEHIGVYVKINDGYFSVKIVDDGRGFSETPAATGLGFHTMQYRAKAIGAELKIESETVGGTIITVTGEGSE